MARIIIEVSDGYFAERSDLDNIRTLAKKTDDPTDLFIDMIVFKKMAELVQEGKNEFTVDSSCLKSEEDLGIFNHAIRNLSALVETGRYKEAIEQSDK